jgi:hypothetical protein
LSISRPRKRSGRQSPPAPRPGGCHRWLIGNHRACRRKDPGAAIRAAAEQLSLSARGTRSVPLRCVARNEPRVGHPISADQAKLSKDIYETKNILKLLHSEGRLGTKPDTDGTYAEFINRVKEAASAGCIGPNVETALAADALTQIRADVLRRVGRPLTFRYLRFLALWGLAGALIGLVMAAAGYWSSVVLIQSMGHYGLVLVGAMAGAWFGVAVRRWQIAFEELPGFLDVNYEPLIRMVFVAVVALVFALFLDLQVLNIKLGSVDLAGFVGGQQPVETALLLGFIAGMSERAVSKQAELCYKSRCPATGHSPDRPQRWAISLPNQSTAASSACRLSGDRDLSRAGCWAC